ASPGAHEPEKRRTAGVSLWTRDAALWNGPASGGKGFNRSRTEGQLVLPGTLRCRINDVGPVLWSASKPLVSLTGDGEQAFTNAYARVLESRYARATVREIHAAESAIIATRFGGSRRAYLAAIAQAHASLA